MPRGRESAIKKQFTLYLDDDLHRMLREYHATVGIEGTPQDTARALIRLGLAADPEPALTAVRQRQAYSAARTFVLRRVTEALRHIADELEAEMRLTERMGDGG